MKLTAKTRITISLVGLVCSVLFFGQILGFVPERSQAILKGRERLCESIAMGASSLLVATRDIDDLQSLLDAEVARNPQLVSAGLRRSDEILVTFTGPHTTSWAKRTGETSTDEFIQISIFDGQNNKWGRLELCFHPINGSAFSSDTLWMLLFAGPTCFVLFHFFLGRMLKQLDPSGAVPKHVREALDNLAEGLLILDRGDRVLLANSAFAEVLGTHPDKLVGHRAAELGWIRDDEDADTRLPWEEALAQERPLSNMTIKLDDANNHQRTFAVNASPLLGHQGKYRGVMVTFDDVTTLEQHRLALSDARDEAEAANRSKSDFLANMSHEIRTPMNAILGFTNVLRNGMDKDVDRQRQHLNTIHSSGTHLLELINDILDLSKIEADRLEVERIPCAVHRIVADVVNVMNVRAEEQGIELAFGFDGPIPESIQSDPARLRQILTNLVGNAIKFTKDGSVSVVTRLDQTGDSALISIQVADTGVGMSADALERIFDPFSQADATVTRRFGGTGLGLSICKKLTTALGGSLDVSSEPGVGSVFTVRIDVGAIDDMVLIEPKSEDVVSDNAAASTVSQRLPGLRVLLVDDSHINRDLLAVVLSEADISFDCATNGQEAVDLASSKDYDAILMDMQMPVMDGYTATRTLRDRGSDIPIIALTAHAMQGEDDKCFAAGCSGFLTKPIDFHLLITTLADQTGVEPVETEASPLQECIDVAAPSTDPAPMVVDPIGSTLPVHKSRFREIVEKFVVWFPVQLVELDAALQQQDLTQIVELAHMLKGAAANVGFPDVSEVARQLEIAGRENDLDSAADCADELRAFAPRLLVDPQPATASV